MEHVQRAFVVSGDACDLAHLKTVERTRIHYHQLSAERFFFVVLIDVKHINQPSITQQEAQLSPRDRATRRVNSQHLFRCAHNCWKQMYNKSGTDRSNGVKGLQSTDVINYMCIQQRCISIELRFVTDR